MIAIMHSLTIFNSAFPAEVSSFPRQSEAVAAATAKHAQLFRVIAEQHARIAAERETLLREEEEKQHLQELGQ